MKKFKGDKTLILLRGCPGSGKSTFAKLLVDNMKCLYNEADLYFYDSNGNYNYDKSKIKDAHNFCKKVTYSEMEIGRSCIIVSNTFTQEWELKDYYELAEKFNYKVFSLIVENRHNGNSIHDVPIEHILKMKDRFEVKL